MYNKKSNYGGCKNVKYRTSKTVFWRNAASRPTAQIKTFFRALPAVHFSGYPHQGSHHRWVKSVHAPKKLPCCKTVQARNRKATTRRGKNPVPSCLLKCRSKWHHEIMGWRKGRGKWHRYRIDKGNQKMKSNRKASVPIRMQYRRKGKNEKKKKSGHSNAVSEFTVKLEKKVLSVYDLLQTKETQFCPPKEM